MPNSYAKTDLCVDYFLGKYFSSPRKQKVHDRKIVRAGEKSSGLLTTAPDWSV